MNKIETQLNELADWHATFPGKDATTVCLLWGESNRQLTELKQQLAAEKAARIKADAAFAEMREVLRKAGWKICGCPGHWTKHGSSCPIGRALSSDRGRGWLSPEDKAKVREYVEESTEHYYPNCYSGKPNPNCRKCQILALLDGKEAK